MMTVVPAVASRASRRAITHERILGALILVEVLVFAAAGSNFLTAQNAAEIVRASGETTVLALALTPVILAGGIDLSCGSLLGLCAVLFGITWHDFGWPVEIAAIVAVLTGVLGGGLNALVIARLGVPPLIVTLGGYSLFRGLAEGLTGGMRNYSGFPNGFLFLGQGFIGPVPVQALVVLAAAAVIWWLVERAVGGRMIRAIGFSPQAARHAGLPTTRTVASVYVLSGFAAGVAALLYVSRLGQAKADAGTGFELAAITAVVLGGTSIFGGRGTVMGTVLGATALAVLQNGLRLADLPVELAGIGAAALLVGALAVNRMHEERIG